MFKIPAWEDDTPKGSTGKTKIKKRKKFTSEKKLHKATDSKTLNDIEKHVEEVKLNKRKSNDMPNNKLVNSKKRKINNLTENENQEIGEKVKASVKKKKLKNKFNLNQTAENVSVVSRFKTNPTKVNKKNREHKSKDALQTIKTLLNVNNGKKSFKYSKSSSNVNVNQTEGKVNIPKGNLEVKSKKVKKHKMKKNNQVGKEIKSIESNKSVTNKGSVNYKKARIKQLLEFSNRNSINVTGNSLRRRMMDRLKAAQFRYLNEKLYTSSGSDARELFQADPGAFQTYHQGYQQQLEKWPVKPLDVIVKRILKMPKSHLVVDMGCGEGTLAKRLSQTCRSFDLVATSPGVEVCDIAHTPLLAGSMDVAVYCLALMGTNLTQYLVEANRILIHSAIPYLAARAC